MKQFILSVVFAALFVCSTSVCEEINDTSQNVDVLLRQAASEYHTPQEVFSWPFYMDVKPQSISFGGGISTVRLYFSPNIECSSADIMIKNIDNLQYLGNMSWQDFTKKGDTTYYDLQLILPPIDTSGLFIQASYGNTKHSVPVYFEPRGDSLVFRFANLKAPFRVDPHQTGRRSYGLTDEEFFQKRREYQERYDSTHPWDTTKVWYRESNGEYVLKQKTHPEKKPTSPWDEIRELEKAPLLDADTQEIEVNGELWRRTRGENKFHMVGSDPDISPWLDSVRAANPNPKYHIVIGFNKAEDSIFVSGLVDSLAPMEQPGYYHTEVTRETLRQIDAQKISYHWYDYFQRLTHPASDDSLKKKSEELSFPLPQSAADTIFFDDFEYSFYNWISGDSNSLNGLDYWYQWPLGQSYSFPNAAWCAAVGGNNWGIYDTNMTAWMTNEWGVQIWGYENVNLSFRLWYDIEAYYDFFQAFYSYDGVSWTRILQPFTGESDGWLQITQALNPLASECYLFFLFTSDEIYNYEGVYIDDIVITGQTLPRKPNLTYDTPSLEWDDALVLSNTAGTHENTPLYSGTETYMDFAIVNNGDTAAPLSTTAVYIDGSLYGYYWAWQLAPGQF